MSRQTLGRRWHLMSEKKKLGGCVIRLQEYEVNEIGKEYVLNYYALGTVLLKQMAEQSFLVLGEMKEEVVSSLTPSYLLQKNQIKILT